MTRHASPFRRRFASAGAAGLLSLLAAAAALAQGTEEQQSACAGDAFTLCRADIPDVAKITACMRVHKAELSPKCRTVFDASDPAKPKVATRPAPRPVDRPQASVTERRRPATDHPHPAPRTFVARPKRVAPQPVPPEPQPAAVPAPSPSSVPGLDSYRASIVTSCRQGLIDPYTCKSTLDLLQGLE